MFRLSSLGGRLVASAMSVALLSGCGPQDSADGYRFGKPEFQRSAIELQVVVHPSEVDLRDAFPGRQPEGRTLMAWSAVSADGDRCEVHIVEPRKVYAPEWLGHEVAHCIYGRWHD